MSDVEWLTREQIDQVIEGMSASDLITAMGDGEKLKGPQMAGAAFDSAAARLGLSNGTPATQHVRMADFAYMAGEITKAVNIESPLSPGQED
jgi:hypothetical protein